MSWQRTLTDGKIEEGVDSIGPFTSTLQWPDLPLDSRTGGAKPLTHGPLETTAKLTPLQPCCFPGRHSTGSAVASAIPSDAVVLSLPSLRGESPKPTQQLELLQSSLPISSGLSAVNPV